MTTAVSARQLDGAVRRDLTELSALLRQIRRHLLSPALSSIFNGREGENARAGRLLVNKNEVFGLRWRLRPTQLGCLVLLFFAISSTALTAATKHVSEDLWALRPVVRPEVPGGITSSTNPIDAFVAAGYRSKNLKPAGPAAKSVLLRRVYLDLIGIPPTPEEQNAFLSDSSPDAYEKVVDRLLASEQHGVRYARHWLDVLRYADTDENMIAAPGIYLWRDWVINALNDDLSYDQFVRTQLTGYRSTTRTQMSATGFRSHVEPIPGDLFALGFLARGATASGGKDTQELAISAVETVSTAFMGMTVGCAKCHDHMYDPIKQRDFYAMKALFDPLVLRKVTLATAADLFASGKALEAAEKRKAAMEAPLNEILDPYRKKLYEDRVAMLPPDVQVIILKPEKQRTVAEQKVADDYYPILRIDLSKILEVMPEAERKKYQDLKKELAGDDNGSTPKRGLSIPVFMTVEIDRTREAEKSYILTSGDPARPETNHPVEPGWPFAPAAIDFREGRVEAFSDWLTAPENPLFARVAINRLWQWHFGEGLQRIPSDFGTLGGDPSNEPLLDWLASEFVRRNFSMKQMHRLIVTSDTYKLASEADPGLAAADLKADPNDSFLWHFRLQRLEAEPIWDSILTAAGDLNLAVGGPSFELGKASDKRSGKGRRTRATSASDANRRAAYITRGYSTSRDVVASFLQAFDVDDGRAPCPMRTQTVTAPQGLFMMNSPEIDKAAGQFAERLGKDCAGDLGAAVELAYRVAIARPPSSTERDYALNYLEKDPSKLKNLAWILFNLDEFVYVR